MPRPFPECCWGEPTSPPMHDGVVEKLAGPDLLKPEPPTVAQPLEHCVAHYSWEAFEPLIGPCWL